MVQIAIEPILRADGSVEEWAIVELQGELEQSTQDSWMAGNFVGDLHYTTKGAPILIIGHHILFGKVADLEKPFALLSKKKKGNTETSEVVADTHHEAEPHTEYVVQAIIKKKLLFKTRPKPIITNVPKKV